MKAAQVFAGLRWSAAATALGMLAQFGFMAVLARQLGPSAFGMVLMATVATRLFGFLCLAGAPQALVQRPTLEAQAATALLMAPVIASLLAYAGLVAASPVAAWYFDAPELVPVLAAFGATLPLSALAALPLAFLRRNARFKAASGIELAGYVLGYGAVGVACAALGLGVWSLVIAALAQQATTAVLAFSAARYPLSWPVPPAVWRETAAASSRFSAIGLAEFLYGNVESLWVGRVFGSAPLGLLNRAQMLANLPVEQAVNTATKVLFPVLSTMQNDRHRLADGFAVLLLTVGLLSGAMAGAISAAATDLVALLLGARWDGAVPLVAALALGVLPTFLYVVCGITLDSMAALTAKLRLQLTMLVVKLLAVGLLASQGLIGVVWAAVGCEALRAAWGLSLMARQLNLRASMLASLLASIGLMTGTVHATVWLLHDLTLAQAWPLWARLAAQLAGAACAAGLVSLALLRTLAFAPGRRFAALQPARWLPAWLPAWLHPALRP